MRMMMTLITMTILKVRKLFQVSHTTRAPREGEEDGVAYNFVSHQQMKEVRKNLVAMMTFFQVVSMEQMKKA